MASLAPVGTSFAGTLEWNGALDDGQVTLAGFCFTADASGLPPTSPTCGALSAVPLLVTGSSVYDGTLPPAGSTFEQAGTTFNGVTGLLNIISFSPTFSVNIPIDMTFDGAGGGSLIADAGALGTASGAFTVDNFAFPPVSGGGGDPNAVPVMPGYGLVLTGAGLVLLTYRRLRKPAKRN